MYDRQYGKQTLTFEASGGLINSSLVMQDRETDTYWPIMKGIGAEGQLKGVRLKELAINRKMKWKKWKRKHPDTLVLSVNGREDRPETYRNYFTSAQGFRGAQATDDRLKTKDPVFVFRLREKEFAIPHAGLSGGKTFQIGDQQIFLYRGRDAQLHDSTIAKIGNSKILKDEDSQWHLAGGQCRFDEKEQRFTGGKRCPEDLIGFDTFWYNWSLNNPDTTLL